VIYRLQYYCVVVVEQLLHLLPYSWVRALARGGGWAAYYLLPKRRAVAFENLQKAYGNSLTAKEKERIVKKSFQNMGLSLVELFMVEKINPVVNENFRATGLHYLKEAFAKGKGIVLVVSHLGSWEYLAFICHYTNHPWAVIVKTVRNPHLNQKIDSLRRSMGLVPIPKQGSIKTVLKKLRENYGVAVLIDQWAGPEGIWQDFFDHPTTTTSIPARLALQTGCALVPAYCLRDDRGGFEIQIHPPLEGELDEKETTSRLNQLLEKQILKYPEQWSWGHRRWKLD